MKFYTTILFLFSLSLSGNTQVGGKHIYKFIDLPVSPRNTALSNSLIATLDQDNNSAWINPALINPQMAGRVSFNYNFHLAQIKSGFLTYADSIKSIKTLIVYGLNFIQYGDFLAADAMGNINGEFKASEYAFQIGASRSFFPNVTFGTNLKVINSRLESYNSFGLSLDLGVYYDKPDKLTSWGFVVRNMGIQFAQYSEGPKEKLPFDIQLGFSKSFKHLPFRLYTTFHHLHRWNLLFDIPDSDVDNTIIGLEETPPSRINMTIDNIFRHFIFGGEFFLGKNDNLALRFGYNHQRKKELSVSPFRSLAGFSGGFGFKVKEIQIDFGFGVFHLAGSNTHLGISTSLDDLFNKNKVRF